MYVYIPIRCVFFCLCVFVCDDSSHTETTVIVEVEGGWGGVRIRIKKQDGAGLSSFFPFVCFWVFNRTAHHFPNLGDNCTKNTQTRLWRTQKPLFLQE